MTRPGAVAPREGSRWAALLCCVAVATAMLAVSAGPAGARPAAGESAGSQLTGCRGELVSRDADGQTLDRAVGEPPHRVVDPDDGEPTFTQAHPFEVVSDGDVVWSGVTTTVITDQSYRLTVWGRTLVSGSGPNDDGDDEGDGTFDVGRVFPVDFTGVVKGDGELTGSGGQCLAAGWVEFGGTPLGSPLWFVALLSTALGVGLFVLAQPRQRPAGRRT